ncbi:glycoside hydrolase family 9 protein [Marinoscillum furvescens]|uniref:Putative secreted protein (Por secretion system target) n=1 Tax=Marinoscillum furvescens DSM 4134 TaxID=1122208 RepID=A0A3D9KVZ7_MARFU|nr:glycoside hydrolase family 9 protein [Marinoscillum furvescens]RED92023.1 putative secreted protein (Por secretion system target) [Marinoscillum furvescens DSM 4134]
MNRTVVAFLGIMLAILPGLYAQVLEAENYIRVDQFGYLPSAYKVAVIAKAEQGFNAGSGIELDIDKAVELINADSKEVVFSAVAHRWNGGVTDSYSGDKGWWFDFTSYTTEGSYYIRAYTTDGTAVDSYSFRIAQDVYQDVLRAAVNMFYYQRINFAKTAEYASGALWTDGEWFEQDKAAIYLNDESILRDMSRGWFDAGDPNKYVTFAVESVQGLLTTYDQHPDLWKALDLKIPESGNSIPDLLDEVKWEIDWLKNMQDFPGTGGFYIKGGIKQDHSYISPPSTDTRARYYDEICPSATVIGAGMLAHAAYTFGQFPALAGYAEELILRAEAAWKYYDLHPEKDKQCDGGEIEAGDADGSGAHYAKEHVAEATCAAAYLYAVTGKEVYNEFVKNNYKSTRPWQSSEWGIYRGNQSEAMLFYTTLSGADASTKEAILNKKTNPDLSESSHYTLVENDNLYRAKSFYSNWGSNSLMSRQGSDIMDLVHLNLKTDKHDAYKERAQAIVNYMHGTNPFGMTYLTNMYQYGAEFSATEMWHSWFATNTIYDNIDGDNIGPAPGFLVGGFNSQNAKDAVVKIGTQTFDATTGEQATQKSYTETNDSGSQPWAFNEPAIYYSTSYIKLLAHFVELEQAYHEVTATTNQLGEVRGTGSYVAGDSAMVYALAEPGYYFTEWSGGATGESQPLKPVMNQSISLDANFAEYTPDDCQVYNGDFELDWSGWINMGAALQAEATSGGNAIVITEDGGVLGSSLIAVGEHNGVEVQADASIEGLVNGASIGVLCLDANKQAISRVLIGVVNDELKSVSGTGEIPEGTKYLQPIIWRAGSTGTYLVDNFCVGLVADYEPPTYQLDVEGGAGDGAYMEGEEVPIDANEAAPHTEFEKWEGDIQYVLNPHDAQTTLRMPPRPATVTAIYKDIYYSLDVISGSGDGSYLAGTEVEIKAFEVQGKKFAQWTGDTDSIKNLTEAVTTLTMPGKDIKVTANFEELVLGGDWRSITIGPNPLRNGTLHIQSEHKEVFVEILDLAGNTVRTAQLTEDQALDLSDLTAGVYLLTVAEAGNTKRFRLIVEK